MEREGRDMKKNETNEFNVKTHQPEPKIGKIDFDTFNSFLLKRLGRKDDSVLVPPLTGIDAGVIDIGDDKVLIIAEDPIFSIPKQPLEMFGWYTVHIGASDVAVMGVKPRYMTYTLLMPPETSEEDFRIIVDSIHKTALELEITIVGGHTGYYPGFAAPTIGGIAVFAVADKDAYVTPSGAKSGDDVILTKGPAIETAGILSVLCEKELLENYPSSLVERAKALCQQMTVVKDALTAMEVSGITAMHDATEGGVIGGLFEIANASQVGMEIDESLFIYPEEVKMVCEAFNIDPVAAIGFFDRESHQRLQKKIYAPFGREHRSLGYPSSGSLLACFFQRIREHLRNGSIFRGIFNEKE